MLILRISCKCFVRAKLAFATLPTPYGNTNANEDLSEAAKFFFVKPAELLAKCPLRHAFLTKAVADWKK